MIRLLLLTLLSTMQVNAKRVLTIYTTTTGNAQYVKQMKLLNEDKAGLADRDILIKTVIYNSKNALLFKQHQVNGDFTITLTGKDGGEKTRSTQPLTLQKLYAIIDAMPMRQQEMKPL